MSKLQYVKFEATIRKIKVCSNNNRPNEKTRKSNRNFSESTNRFEDEDITVVRHLMYYFGVHIMKNLSRYENPLWKSMTALLETICSFVLETWCAWFKLI